MTRELQSARDRMSSECPGNSGETHSYLFSRHSNCFQMSPELNSISFESRAEPREQAREPRARQRRAAAPPPDAALIANATPPWRSPAASSARDGAARRRRDDGGAHEVSNVVISGNPWIPVIYRAAP